MDIEQGVRIITMLDNKFSDDVLAENGINDIDQSPVILPSPLPFNFERNDKYWCLDWSYAMASHQSSQHCVRPLIKRGSFTLRDGD